ncbi:haloacid dehalogenase [Streptococcus azizii]|uniref:Haloacid dehalogenase n=1 Tax=Streptococcus azizii TaxID=1579424 RepID=A0AB36JRB0_9STRE|nr:MULTISPECIES: HAD hydrolase-like protein [Streptococcus]MBF0775871.1 HAD family hydrolase [Streptococcus sp. 19428wD3_AN2]ONK27454.1 haloacid dehalogenase [Streptococcus azizii]ONK28691.1 haloacid dehalogenase [Streptococcus azizii]ONK29387.1 haloacid dehalogenase [Streptococcus azizii]TFU83921.1 HAD family hydrolase [Streptococcus sp. AN2]
MDRDYVFCIDSDGCAMDTMTYKHQLFFGPLAAEIFDISDKADFLTEWNRVNLYSKTRGINRFVGLLTGLKYAGVTGIDRLEAWVTTTPSLSNDSLKEALESSPSEDLQKALDWSLQVNQSIKDYKGEVRAFEGVREALAFLATKGKIFVVSSANKEAVLEEWQTQGLLEFVDDLYCQDRGKKEDVLSSLVKSGYERSQMLMIGDSPGDLKAAEQNGLSFYPILVGKEAASWQNLLQIYSRDWLSKEWTKALEAELIDQFWKNLK